MRVNELEARIATLEQRADAAGAGIATLAQAMQNLLYTRDTSQDLQSRILGILETIRPYSVKGFAKIRIGSPNDGGYICIDDLSPITRCISCGIGDNDDFDLDIAERGIEVLQFDHTVDAAPSQHENLKFFKERIAGTPEDGARTLSSLVQSPGGNGPSMLLKIDIEGGEWPVFDAMPEKELNSFRQIVAEFHGFNGLPDDGSATTIGRVLEKLSRSFFVCHVHANNFCGMEMLGGVPIPHLLELTLANRNVYEPVEGREIFPTAALDAPNNAARPDYRLGCFWF